MKVVERIDSLKNMTVDIDKSLASLPEMTKNTTSMLENAKRTVDQLSKYLISDSKDDYAYNDV